MMTKCPKCQREAVEIFKYSGGQDTKIRDGCRAISAFAIALERETVGIEAHRARAYAEIMGWNPKNLRELVKVLLQIAREVKP